ncbi:MULTISPECIES: aspartate aminotransferase family protein [Oceanotoga]|jgi:acetylornithine/N-succinyldiaminopimelate aminotransferase|uniref:aspartate aminotransferase family protein n=1 Tax=Oceanotoga TaxID=1255275 RepID=UPI002657157E|nr:MULTISPECIES: aspartate aminotransferase family protein [Oceanotoga]MDN5342679.1 acetylornithine/N-succinyldiaminopimelate aminotransferase [Oceanotoga sp.]MDO7976759.1 aspartate aminotransferase family protein [Oceanotoga teriensis]
MNYLKMYDSFDIEIQNTDRMYIYDIKGNKYIDTFSGIGVNAFGHSYKPLIETMENKMKKFIHISNLILDKEILQVSEKISKRVDKKSKIYFSNSGAEAIEASLKAIKKISTKQKNKIIYFTNSFHGRTLGALSINGFENLKKPFYPLYENTVELPFNDSKKLKQYFDKNAEQIIALYIETIQGSGGVNPINQEFANTINDLKEKYNFVLIADEIQSGLGRTGKFYSYENFNIKPDIITSAKALGGGLPLGATIFTEKYADILQKGDHGTTFAPNPVAISAANYLIENINELMQNVNELSPYFMNKLSKLSKVKQIRGKGFMIGVEIIKEDPELKQKAYENGILLNIIKNKTIRLLPPLNTTKDEIDEIIKKLESVI